MSMEELTPYDQLPENVAANPFVRDVYVRQKLIEDDRGNVKGKVKKSSGPKIQWDWKMYVIIGCFSVSAYFMYGMFFGRTMSVESSAAINAQIEDEIKMLELQAANMEGAEKEEMLQMISTMKQSLQGVAPDLRQTAGPGPGGAKQDKKKPKAKNTSH